MWNIQSFTLTPRRYQKVLLLLGHLFFGILIVYSLVFYKERMLHFDSAYYAFNMLYDSDFYIAHGRTVSYASQLLPLLVLKMGGSLQTFLMVFSLSFMLLFYGMFCLIVYGFKNVEGGIFLALAVSTMVRFKFYAAISEVYFSLALAALLIGWLTKNNERFSKWKLWQHSLVTLLLILLLTTGHPIIVLPVMSFLAVDLVYHRRWKDLYHWSTIAFTALVFYFRFRSIRSEEGSYESNRLEQILVQLEDWQSLLELNIWTISKWYFETQYALPVVFFLILLIVMIVQRHWWSALVLLLSSLGIVLVVLLSFAYVNGKIYAMIDGYVGLLGIIFAIPILYIVLRSKYRFLSVSIVTFLLVFNLHRIYGTRTFFQKREALLTELVELNAQPDQRKLVLRLQDFIWDKFWYPWTLPYETLLLSSIAAPEQAATIYVAGWNEQEEKWSKFPEKLLGDSDGRQIKKFPKQYFQLDQNRPVLIQRLPKNYR